MDIPDSTTLKRCSKCGGKKPHDQFHRDKAKKDGLQYQCKACVAEEKRKYYAENAETRRAYGRKYRAENAEAVSERRRKRYAENREVNIEYSRKYRTDNAQVVREYKRRHRAEHPEVERERNRKYRAEHPEAVQLWNQRRRARRINLPDIFTTSDWQVALDHFENCCSACGRPVGLWHTLAPDHWIPLSSSDCPGTVAWNIVPLCHGNGGCNNSKKDKPPTVWLIEKFGPKKGRAIQRRIEAFLDSRRPAS